ncbi:ABC transporter substrate-binding protein [Micromonospora sp. NPDC047740]|uniref:ABC transporter substrate-binding protein n=1 Tax=Micromonospora sp. NPDC047740 TaxID=3364254 RepID=UPI003716C1F6
MRNKILSAGFALALVGGLAAGCGGSDSGGSANEISLVMSNHPWQKAIEPLIPEFEKASGVKVKVQTFAEQQARDKISLNLQSRSSSMDVFMTLPSREGLQFSKAGYYAPLDDYMSKSAAYDVADFPAAVKTGMTIQDKMIAAPVNVEGVVLYYRTDLFKQYGITPPKTLDELPTVAAAIKQKSGGKVTPIALRGQSAALPFTFGPFLHSQGLEWTKPDGTPNFDNPGAADAINRYATLAKDYGPPGVVNNTFTQSSALFAAGNAAMELESSNEISSINDPKTSKVVGKIGVLDFPAGSAGSKSTVLNWGIAMSSYSKHKDAAWKFIEWATGKATQLKLTTDGIAPPRTSVAQDKAYTDTLNTETLKEWSRALANVQANGSTEVGPVGVAAPEMRKVVGDAVGKVILGQADANAAAKEIQDGLTPLLAKNAG